MGCGSRLAGTVRASWLTGLVWTALLAGAAGFIFAPGDVAANQCGPRQVLPSVILRSMGPCNFDLESLSFAGDPAQQAACLLRPVGRRAILGPPLTALPKVLAERVGRSALLPGRAALAAAIADMAIDRELADGLFGQLSRAADGDPFAPTARYFVIHDTSGPKLDAFSFGMDFDPKINDLEKFRCKDSSEIAHAVINRKGDMLMGHDFGVPWRSTKFENAVAFGTALKGLFLHVEMVQPRRADSGRQGDDSVAPEPGFTFAQYERLALLYVIASVRAGAWLVPAFHAVIDSGIRGGHDDPQNFDLTTFAMALDRIVWRLTIYEIRSAFPSSAAAGADGYTKPMGTAGR
jgi:hypothetical protein